MQDPLINKLTSIIKNTNPLFVFDSRKIKKGDIFIGIKSTNDNGSNYYKEAIEKGCLLAIIDKKIDHKKTLYTKNVFNFLKKLSDNLLDNYKGKIIAITGSVGKTSFKENICHILNNKKIITYKSYKNFNNELGLIISVCNLNFKSKFSIFELGINRDLEMIKLRKILNPHFVLISNIENSHIGNFKSYKNLLLNKLDILKSKNLIFALVNITKSHILIPKPYKQNKKIEFINYKNDIKIKSCISNKSKFELSYTHNFRNYKIQTQSNTAVTNNIAVISNLFVINFYKHNLNSIYFYKKSLIDGHGNIIKVNKKNKNYEIYNHSYNASPYSMIANLDNFLNISNKSKSLIILGSMKELGSHSKKYHSQISNMLKNYNLCYFIGSEFKELLDNSGDFKCYLTYSELLPNINKKLQMIKHIFVMGSRSNNLDKLVKELC